MFRPESAQAGLPPHFLRELSTYNSDVSTFIGVRATIEVCQAASSGMGWASLHLLNARQTAPHRK